jgi:hypothetical protein
LNLKFLFFKFKNQIEIMDLIKGLAVLKQFDKNGDGKITEEGN